MVKPEWGTKRTCPKCSTRFYDLTNDNPVHCIECGTEWVPEPVLKSKQPMAFEPAAQVAKEPAQDDELGFLHPLPVERAILNTPRVCLELTKSVRPSWSQSTA